MNEENVNYRKVFIARGFDKFNGKPFILAGTSYSSDAIKRFTEKQVCAFNIGIVFSKNFFNVGENEILEYIEYIKDMFIPVSEEIESTLNFGVNTNCYYVKQEDLDRIIGHLRSKMSQEEKELKKIKKQNYKE